MNKNTLSNLCYLVSVEYNRDLCLELALPYSGEEVCEKIIVPAKYVPDKINYIEQAYDENLVSINNEGVKIVKFYFL